MVLIREDEKMVGSLLHGSRKVFFHIVMFGKHWTGDKLVPMN